MPDRSGDGARLADQAAQLGVALDRRQAERLLEFARLVAKWNRVFNLIGRGDVERLLPRHVLDSLSVAPWLVGRQVLDVGTGAGFPGIPLAIAREDAHFTLVDTHERKIRFIRQTVRSLDLDNVTPCRSDVAALDPSVRFDSVVSRALADPGRLWELVRDRLRPGGRLVAMTRARIAESDTEAPAGPALPDDAELERRCTVRIPGLAERHELLLVRHRDSAATRSRA
ncbi:MAG TPA: 16S rRNA (guanine(527)-N(7))-methyltransferase RsmG [Pseudomonadales bacterium]